MVSVSIAKPAISNSFICDFAAVIQTRDGYVAILADGDGKTKAQTKALEKNEAVEIFNKVIESGIPEFNGDQVEIWTEKYPVIRD